MPDKTIAAIHPTTSVQQGFVLGTLAVGDEPLFVEQAVLPLTGELDVPRLQRAYEELVAAHEILRTAFAWQLAGAPKQVVLSHVAAQLSVTDSRALSPEKQRAALDETLRTHREEPFDLTRAPLLRLAAHSLDDTHHRIVWTHHHAILDGWAHLRLIHDLLQRYNTSTRPAQPPAFSAYARWLTRQDTSAHQNYWSQQFAQFSPLPEPAAETARQNGERFGRHEITLTDGEAAVLNTGVRDHDTTAATTIIGCWAMVCALLRRRNDIAVGITVSGRACGFPGAEDVIGPLATTVAMRVTFGGKEQVGDWLRGIQRRLTEADGHSLCTAADLQTWTGAPAGMRLYDSVVSIANYPWADGQAAGPLILDHAGIRGEGGRTRSSLALIVEMFDGIRLRLVNDRATISDQDANTALHALRGLLTAPALTAADTATADLIDALPGLPEIAAAAPVAAAANHTVTDPVTQVIAAAFSEVLGHAVGAHTDFLAAGGHSLLGLRLLARLRTALAVDLTLGDLIGAPNPAALAARVRNLLGQDQPALQPLPDLVTDPAEAGKPFPLTGIQQAYWTGRTTDFHLGGVDSLLYTEVDLPHLNLARLEQVWQHLIDRHPMLRAVVTHDGQQQILPRVPAYRIHTQDLREVASPQTALARTRQRLAHARRDPEQWPLFTVESALLPNGTTRLFISVDMLIGDALSWQILYREARTLYENADAELPELHLTFADYVRHLASITSTARYAADRDYWRARLPELPAPPDLPTTPTVAGAPRFTRRQLTLPATDLRALRMVAARHGATLSALLMAVFAETLSRFTGSNRFLLNVTVYNRPDVHPQMSQIVGDFTSTVLADVRLDAPTFADRLRALQRQLWADLDHVLYSGVDVLRDLADLHGDRTGAAAPVVFTSTLDLAVAGPDPQHPFPGTIGYGLGQTPQVLLDYQTYEVAGHLTINFDSLSGALPGGYVEAMADEHTRALRTLIDDPAAPRRPRLATAASAEPLDPPLGGAQLLHEPFLRQAHENPGRTAVVCDGQRISYGQLLGDARRIAQRIAAAEPSGELVALLCNPGADQVAAALGILISGYAFVPMDAAWPQQRIEELLAATGASVVVTQQDVAVQTRLPDTITTILTTPAGAAQDGGCAPAPRARAADDLAYVIFTSGSTGLPKGVMISHEGALNTVLDINARFGITETDRVLAISPFTFDLAVYDLFGLLAAGGTIVIPTRDQRGDPAAWIDLLNTEQVTVWNSVPVLMGLLTDAVPAEPVALGPLRLCLLSGDWIPLDLPAAVRARAPQCRMISLGGATEGSIWSILHEIGEIGEDWTSIPYGKAMTGQTVQALDEQLLPCPVWAAGQLYIGGHGTALGYWGDDDLTGKAFVFDGRTGRRLYRTGDWGRLRPDGALEFLGRRDDQVKIRGYRVELREVETALAAVDGVTQAAVVAVGDRTARRLAGFVVTGRDPAAVRSDLARRLPSHMLPATISVLSQIPVNATSKVDRKSLTTLAAQLGPEPGADPAHRPTTASASVAEQPVREALATLVSAQPGSDDDLLDLGLTSVDVIRLANLVEKHTGGRPDLRAFYASPTLRTLLATSEAVSPPAGPAHASAWTGWPRLTGPDERAAFRARRAAYGAPPGQRVLPSREPLALPERQARRTPRTFARRLMPATALSDLLDCMRRVDLGDRMAYRYPSAGGLYPVAVRVHVRPGRVDGVQGGLYTYHPDAHDLSAHLLDVDLDQDIHLGTLNHHVAATAAFTLFLTVDPADIAPLYGDDGEALALLDAGYMGQLLCQSALETGLALCPVHGVDFDAVRWMLPDAERHVLLHTLLGGIPASGSGRTEEARR